VDLEATDVPMRLDHGLEAAALQLQAHVVRADHAGDFLHGLQTQHARVLQRDHRSIRQIERDRTVRAGLDERTLRHTLAPRERPAVEQHPARDTRDTGCLGSGAQPGVRNMDRRSDRNTARVGDAIARLHFAPALRLQQQALPEPDERVVRLRDIDEVGLCNGRLRARGGR
jgi:hypothetical protein